MLPPVPKYPLPHPLLLRGLKAMLGSIRLPHRDVSMDLEPERSQAGILRWHAKQKVSVKIGDHWYPATAVISVTMLNSKKWPRL